jgi:cell division protein FtsZ
VNTESKKIIHTLEDEQKAVHNLSSGAIVHQLVEEDDILEVSETKQIFIEEDPMELIPTSKYIRNFNVFYEEVIAENVSEDDFVIIQSKESLNDIEVVDFEEIKSSVDDDQFVISFDMPLNTQNVEEDESENVVTFNLDDEVKNMDVREHIEVIPVLEYNKEGETRYSLDDYMELENRLTGAKSKAEDFDPKIIEDELVFEKKVVAVTESETSAREQKEIDPMDTPLEELLKQRADVRRKKLKDFNYKFQNSLNNIDEIEKEPAYKRQGVDLKEGPRENRFSRTTLSEDSNDEIQFRSNNSFLHDNVD